jgi:tight adherence protein B
VNASDALAIVLGLVLGAGLFLVVVALKPSRIVEGARHGIPWRVVALSALLASAGFVIALALCGVIGLAIAVAGLVAGTIPWWRARRRRKHDELCEASFPEIVETIISRLRSGDTLLGALSESCANAPRRIVKAADEFSQAYRVTGNADLALDDLKGAWAHPTADLIVETVRLAHDTGGANTVQVLRDLADHIRADRNLRRDIEAKQSWVRVAARVGVAAPWVVLAFLSLRGEAASAYNSPVGLTVLVVGLMLSVAAYWSMVAMGAPARRERIFTS